MTTFTKYLNQNSAMSEMRVQKNMHMAKKGLILSIALSSVFALSACSNENEEKNASAPDSSAEMSQATQQNTMDVKQPEPVEQTKQSLVEPVTLPKAETVTDNSISEKPVENTAAVPEITPKAPVVKANAEEGGIEVAEKKVEEKAEAAKEVVASVNGQQVYATCAGCHGAQAEGGIGPKLAGQAVADIIDKLTRYKAGEQIGPLTGMMAPMAAPLSDDEMQAVAEYTASL